MREELSYPVLPCITRGVQLGELMNLSSGSVGGNSWRDEDLNNNPEQLRVLLAILARASQATTSTLPTDGMIMSVLELAVQGIGAALCLLLVVDKAQHSLSFRACVPTLIQPDEVPLVVFNQQSWDLLQQIASRDQREALGIYVRQHLQLPKEWVSRDMIGTALIQGGEFVGLLCSFSQQHALTSAQDQSFLECLAGMLAVALVQDILHTFLETHREVVKQLFFDNLAQPGLASPDQLRLEAAFLECDLSQSHILVMLQIDAIGDRGDATSVSEIARPLAFADDLLRHQVVHRYPGSIVFQQERVFIILFPLRDSPTQEFVTWLRELALRLADQHQVRLCVGITDTVSSLGEYRQRFDQASRALQTSLRFQPKGGVVHVNEIAIYRYLGETPGVDQYLFPYAEKIALLVEYDRQHGGQGRLLGTLEAFLDTGAINKAAAYLQRQQGSRVSGRTVNQRLHRIQELLDLDILGDEMTQEWFFLNLAIKSYRLHQ
jgi:sugar diacid utilization regulator